MHCLRCEAPKNNQLLCFSKNFLNSMGPRTARGGWGIWSLEIQTSTTPLSTSSASPSARMAPLFSSGLCALLAQSGSTSSGVARPLNCQSSSVVSVIFFRDSLGVPGGVDTGGQDGRVDDDAASYTLFESLFGGSGGLDVTSIDSVNNINLISDAPVNGAEEAHLLDSSFW